jgi:alkanesulfonate monooxygenase SsuD/methylene tetrahydromethanopterin reductase-like flavin-dependent oxidoreductase (luciferase family)
MRPISEDRNMDRTAGQTPLVELGLDTFGDVTVDADGRRLTDAEVIRNVVEEAVLADRLGVDFIGVGEHHRDDFAVASPETVLAAIAGRTERIRLGSAVTVLSSDDPVRVFQRFATLDAVSNGRAEVILGRGSFIESFPLFGYQLDQYEELFEEKLDLFSVLLAEQPVTWSGDALGPAQPAGVPAHGRWPHHLGRRRWEPAVGGPRRQVRPAADDRDHRWRERALRTLRRPLPACPHPVRTSPTSITR